MMSHALSRAVGLVQGARHRLRPGGGQRLHVADLAGDTVPDVLRITQHPTGPRLWICGHRVHHGLTGVLLVLAGVALAAHDRHDRASWFARELLHQLADDDPIRIG